MLLFFRDADGRTPFLDWYERLPEKARIRCGARLELLAEQGHRLRRPAADYLRDGIYELRATAGRVQYRMLYFFNGQVAVVISHGIMKQGATVPPIEIERATRRRLAFAANPQLHTHGETP
jgi:phage-related protein